MLGFLSFGPDLIIRGNFLNTYSASNDMSLMYMTKSLRTHYRTFLYAFLLLALIIFVLLGHIFIGCNKNLSFLFFFCKAGNPVMMYFKSSFILLNLILLYKILNGFFSNSEPEYSLHMLEIKRLLSEINMSTHLNVTIFGGCSKDEIIEFETSLGKIKVYEGYKHFLLVFGSVKISSEIFCGLCSNKKFLPVSGNVLKQTQLFYERFSDKFSSDNLVLINDNNHWFCLLNSRGEVFGFDSYSNTEYPLGTFEQYLLNFLRKKLEHASK